MGGPIISSQRSLKSAKSIKSEGNQGGSDKSLKSFHVDEHRRSSGPDRSPERRRSNGSDKSPERRRSTGADKSPKRSKSSGTEKLAECRRSSGIPNGLSKSLLRLIFHEARHLLSGSDQVGAHPSDTKLQKACRVVLGATHNMLCSHDVVEHWQDTAKALAFDREQAAEDEHDVDESFSFGGDSEDGTNENCGIDIVNTLLDRFVVESGDRRKSRRKTTKRDSLKSYLKELVVEAVELQRSHQDADVRATQEKYRRLLQDFEGKLQELESSKQTFKNLAILANKLEMRFRSEECIAPDDDNLTCDESSRDLRPDSYGSVHQHIDAIMQIVGKSVTSDDSSVEESDILELLEAVGLKEEQEEEGSSSDALIGKYGLNIEEPLAVEEAVASLGDGTDNEISDNSDPQRLEVNLQSGLFDELHVVTPQPPAAAKSTTRPPFRSGRFSRPTTPATTPESLQHENGEPSHDLNLNSESVMQEKAATVQTLYGACSITEARARLSIDKPTTKATASFSRPDHRDLLTDLSSRELMLRIKERIDSEYEHSYASHRTLYPHPKASPLSQRIKFNSLPSLCQEAYNRSIASSPARSPSSSRELCEWCSDWTKQAHSPVSTRSSSKKAPHLSLEFAGEEKKPVQSPIASRSSSRSTVHAPPDLDFGSTTPPSNRKIVLPPVKSHVAEIDIRHTNERMMSPQTRQSSGSPAPHSRHASKQESISVATLAAKINCEMTRQHLEAVLWKPGSTQSACIQARIHLGSNIGSKNSLRDDETTLGGLLAAMRGPFSLCLI